jgi:ABC-2 type transport system ATP-binding protein
MTHALAVHGLGKRFASVRALDGVDLAVPEGSVYGFLGPNGRARRRPSHRDGLGARADAGTVEFFGRDAREQGARDGMGFLPDVPGFYPWMRAEEFPPLRGRLFGLSGSLLERRVASLLDMAGLAGVKTRIGGFSRGMKQRLGIAQALINAPRLLLLDEPTSALDPLGRKAVLDMIAGLKGRTHVLFSTHILSDAERVCDGRPSLSAGRVVAETTWKAFLGRVGSGRTVLELEGGTEPLRAALSAKPWCREVRLREDGCLALSIADAAAARKDIPALIASMGLGLVSMREEEASLEDAFIRLVGGKDA